MSDKQVVVAIFKDEAAADGAVEGLKAWDKADDDIKLNAIGVLVLDDKGKIKTHKLGRRSVGKGAGIGLVLAVLTPPTLLVGVLGGGLLGGLHHKGLGVTAADRDRIAADLADGKAAVGVLAAEVLASEISAKLTELGGTAEVLTVSEEAVAEVDEVAPAVEAAEAAAPPEAADASRGIAGTDRCGVERRLRTGAPRHKSRPLVRQPGGFTRPPPVRP